MPGVFDRAEPDEHSRSRTHLCGLPRWAARRHSGLPAFAAQYPAYISSYRLLDCILTDAAARLGANVVR
jgi:hypothetical protein